MLQIKKSLVITLVLAIILPIFHSHNSDNCHVLQDFNDSKECNTCLNALNSFTPQSIKISISTSFYSESTISNSPIFNILNQDYTIGSRAPPLSILMIV